MRSDYVTSQVKDEWHCNEHNTYGKLSGPMCVYCENIMLKDRLSKVEYLHRDNGKLRI